ncbi:sensor domain-containing diguanylate cyclase [Desulfurella sp.]|uniref:sensor domain-containing diguanylate cyclase n=1 Tax=Desulfurella sp. TaxID=1962857 RepID=UPI0025BB53FB|nr:sensor domain-containing diguanylate cyclase [Desulfurella sp.]
MENILNLESLKFIFENIQIGVCVIESSTNKIVYVNKHFCELVDLQAQEILNLEDPFVLFSTKHIEYVKDYINFKLNDVDDASINKKYVKLRRIKKSKVVNTKFRILKFEQDSKTYLCLSAINITNLIKEKRAIAEKAETDFLTGIFNRLSIETKLNEFSNYSYGVIMFDVDNFKYFNDTYGHSMGDEILKKIVQEVKFSLRSKDIFARWGGDEFLILISDVSAKDLIKIANKIKNKVSSIDFGIDEKVTISIGAGIFDNQTTTELVIESIDKALYKAKHKGKNKVMWYL